MLQQLGPDVVHVTTPVTSHFSIAMDALAAGAHVIVEKPATVTFPELTTLVDQASASRRHIVEDYPYLYSSQIKRIRHDIESGAMGQVVRIEIQVNLDLGPITDPHCPHPSLSLPGGAISDFLPHLASLAHLFIGPARQVRTHWQKLRPGMLPFDEFSALVTGERAVAALGFSANAQPDAFHLRVYGTRMQAHANLFKTFLSTAPAGPGPRALVSARNGLVEGAAVWQHVFRSLSRGLQGGPGTYEGLWDLLRATYSALGAGQTPPVTAQQVLEVNRLVSDLVAEANRI